MRDRPTDKHRRLAEQRLGRKLHRDEIVHHKNEDKTDNSPGNHEIVPRGKHTSDHNKARGLSKLRAALRMGRDGKRLY